MSSSKMITYVKPSTIPHQRKSNVSHQDAAIIGSLMGKAQTFAQLYMSLDKSWIGSSKTPVKTILSQRLSALRKNGAIENKAVPKSVILESVKELGAVAEEKRSQLKAARAEVRKAVRAEKYKKRKAAFMELEDKVKDLESQLLTTNVQLDAANAQLDAANARLLTANANAVAAIERADLAGQDIEEIEEAFSASIENQKSLNLENTRLAHSLSNYNSFLTICYLCSLLCAGIYFSQKINSDRLIGIMGNISLTLNCYYNSAADQIAGIFENAPDTINTLIRAANTFATDLYERIPLILNHNNEFLQRFA